MVCERLDKSDFVLLCRNWIRGRCTGMDLSDCFLKFKAESDQPRLPAKAEKLNDV